MNIVKYYYSLKKHENSKHKKIYEKQKRRDQDKIFIPGSCTSREDKTSDRGGQEDRRTGLRLSPLFSHGQERNKQTTFNYRAQETFKTIRNPLNKALC